MDDYAPILAFGLASSRKSANNCPDEMFTGMESSGMQDWLS